MLFASLLLAAHGLLTFDVGENGGLEIGHADDGVKPFATVDSAFSEPGPVWHNLTATPSSADAWSVHVDRSKAFEGVWTVTAKAPTFSLTRVVTLNPPPHKTPLRVLINDTFSTPTTMALSHDHALPSLDDIIGIYVRHTAISSARPHPTSPLPLCPARLASPFAAPTTTLETRATQSIASTRSHAIRTMAAPTCLSTLRRELAWV